MEFPKPIMTISELNEMGFSKESLLTAYRAKGQTFARKLNPQSRNSKIEFDTTEFYKWWLAQVSAQNRAIQRGRRGEKVIFG